MLAANVLLIAYMCTKLRALWAPSKVPLGIYIFLVVAMVVMTTSSIVLTSSALAKNIAFWNNPDELTTTQKVIDFINSGLKISWWQWVPLLFFRMMLPRDLGVRFQIRLDSNPTPRGSLWSSIEFACSAVCCKEWCCRPAAGVGGSEVSPVEVEGGAVIAVAPAGTAGEAPQAVDLAAGVNASVDGAGGNGTQEGASSDAPAADDDASGDIAEVQQDGTAVDGAGAGAGVGAGVGSSEAGNVGDGLEAGGSATVGDDADGAAQAANRAATAPDAAASAFHSRMANSWRRYALHPDQVLSLGYRGLAVLLLITYVLQVGAECF